MPRELRTFSIKSQVVGSSSTMSARLCIKRFPLCRR
jgi:hypothetical protein